MSDNWIRIIPTTPTWAPQIPNAETATAYVRSLFTGPTASADDVTHSIHAGVAFIDSGVNTSSVTCSACGKVTDVAWVFDIIDERAEDLSQLDAAMPCCGASANLNDLNYDWPMAFARFEIEVMNGTRDGYELDVTELDHVGSLLGHSVRQVLQHI
ncbi:hypothetical protein [Nocardioides sp. J54]|uniref:hypothetical protein n=1 Tax=Nocardioides sp. J54 TaxID=935866 RepID=UPI00048AF0AF|nr:hypothetical protein [Nocardioides sp. J54]